jgi:hypothetical protein
MANRSVCESDVSDEFFDIVGTEKKEHEWCPCPRMVKLSSLGFKTDFTFSCPCLVGGSEGSLCGDCGLKRRRCDCVEGSDGLCIPRFCQGRFKQ